MGGNVDRLLQEKCLLENEGHGSPIAGSYTSDDESSNMHGNKSVLDEFVHTLKLQVDSLTQKVSECQSNSEKIAKMNVELEQLKGKDLNSLNNFKELEQFKHKNDELERENISLREINANLTSTLSELNIKLKAIESERMSLVTLKYFSLIKIYISMKVVIQVHKQLQNGMLKLPNLQNNHKRPDHIQLLNYRLGKYNTIKQ